MEILIEHYNRLDHDAVLGRPEGTHGEPISLCQFVGMKLSLVNGRRLMPFLRIPDIELSEDEALLQDELDSEAGKKLDLFLKKIRLCPRPCGRAFWPPRSDSRVCEKCKADSAYRKLKAGREDARAELLQKGYSEEAIADELSKQGYPPARRPRRRR